MKQNFLFILFFLFIHHLQAQNDTISIKELKTIFEKAKIGVLTGEELNQARKKISIIQNQAFVLDERQHDYSEALKIVNITSEYWRQLKDTNSLANILKYIGLLEGRLNHYKDAKLHINQAIDLFEKKGYPMGVAVSKFDMSKVYELQGRYDSSFYYISDATNFWSSKLDTSRIVVNNIQMINVLTKLNHLQEAQKIAQKIEPMLMHKRVFPLNKADFYYVMSQLYKTMLLNDRYAEYLSKYNVILKTEKEKGNTLKSSYE